MLSVINKLKIHVDHYCCFMPHIGSGLIIQGFLGGIKGLIQPGQFLSL
ncbi:MAG: hypothetical protein PUC85_05410 [bacterium]|nr:hypothetical protein [Parabacteroides sp.]MDD6079591.1 hypothetical protein [bacterium]